MKFHLTLLMTALLALSGMQASAEGAREVTWDDLVPAELDFDDPFEKLTEDQLYNLAVVARYREQKESKAKSPDFTEADYNEAISNLKDEKIDIDGLIARRGEITEKRRLRGQTANAELNGKNIRLPGYLLPLEFKEKKVTEFLLVPWVGACIHTPPPPPNQIVHVVYPAGFEVTGLFDPVWVEGQLQANATQSRVDYSDGTATVLANYGLDAGLVEKY